MSNCKDELPRSGEGREEQGKRFDDQSRDFLRDVAFIVGDALYKSGISAVLSGGGAATVYAPGPSNPMTSTSYSPIGLRWELQLSA